MKDFSFSDVLGLMVKTAPFLFFRFLIYFAITFGFLMLAGIGAGIGYTIGFIANNAPAGGFLGGLVGLGAAAALMFLLREYLLYMVKAGHIAVLAELADGGTIPEGKAQIAYARQEVQKRFETSNVLFGVDQLVKGILRAFNRAFLNLEEIIPISGASGLLRFVKMILDLSISYLDEIILAYLIKTKADNPWASSKTGLILYAQNYTSFLKNALWLAFFSWTLTFLVFLLVLGPAALLVQLIPASGGPLTLIAALVMAWGIKQALIEPAAMTGLMLAYFKVTEGQAPNRDWEEKLENVSSQFRQLKKKAGGWGRQTTPDKEQPVSEA